MRFTFCLATVLFSLSASADWEAALPCDRLAHGGA